MRVQLHELTWLRVCSGPVLNDMSWKMAVDGRRRTVFPLKYKPRPAKQYEQVATMCLVANGWMTQESSD